MITIAQESPLQDDIRQLVEELNAYVEPTAPPEFHFNLTVEEMAEPSVSLFVAREEGGEAVAMASLMLSDEGYAEVKRMYSKPKMRGKHVATKLLNHVEQLAHEHKIVDLKLETGVGQPFEAAHRLYERNGFEACDAFGDYPQSEHSKFYTKKIA